MVKMKKKSKPHICWYCYTRYAFRKGQDGKEKDEGTKED